MDSNIGRSRRELLGDVVLTALAIAAVTAAAVAATIHVEGLDATLVATIGVAVAAVVGTALVVSALRYRQTDVIESYEREVQRDRAVIEHDRRRREFERELDNALRISEREDEILDVIRAAMDRIDPDRPVELHVVDADSPRLRLAFATGIVGDPPPAGVASPWESLAARTGRTLVYDSTTQLDACPHLRSRVTEPCSAVCVPMMAMGRILGVIYATGPDGSAPTPNSVELIEMIAARTASQIAVVRAFEAPDEPLPDDPLTNLPGRLTVQRRILELVSERIPFAIGIVDIDNFSRFNEDHGQRVGDGALRQLARTVNDVVRPTDIVGRLANDQLMIAFADTSALDAAQAIERIRESLIIAQASQGAPAFTISVGVTDSSTAGSIDDIIRSAELALEAAKDQGRNRVVVAGPETPTAA